MAESHRGMLSKIVDRKVYPFILLGSTVAAWGLWYQDPSRGWVLAVALLPLAIAVLGGRMPVRPTPLDVPMGVFLLTAGVGVWTAYDRAGTRAIFVKSPPVGWQALWGLVLAVFVFYALTVMETETQQRWVLALMAGFGAVVAVWFAAANDWTAHPAKLAVVTRIGKAIQIWLPALSDRWLNNNIPGGIMAILLSTSLALVINSLGRDWKRRWPWIVWGLVTGVFMVFGLILTTTRGGWMGVGCSLALGSVWWLAARLHPGRQRLRVFLALVGFGALIVVGLVALLPSLRVALQGSQVIANRLGIFSETVLLVRDYPFTGIGLGQFALVHSTYALMIHVPILPYAHSLILDVALGQGVLGVLAVVIMLGGSVWLGLRALTRSEEPPPALIAGLLSLPIMAVHGLVDDPLYGGRGVLLLWVPAGLVVAGWRSVSAEPSPAVQLAAPRWRVWGMAAIVGLVLLGLFWRPVGAVWYANLGAVSQTRTELGLYDPKRFDNPTLDQIRAQADLSVAEGFFARSLDLNPGQVTARTRLAEIALGREQYDRALAHVQAAWDVGHRDRVVRLLLGDVLVATGEVKAGVEVVRGLEWAEGRLEGQAWYRYWLGGDYCRAARAWQAVAKLNPKNDRAEYWYAQAEARAGNQ